MQLHVNWMLPLPVRFLFPKNPLCPPRGVFSVGPGKQWRAQVPIGRGGREKSFYNSLP